MVSAVHGIHFYYGDELKPDDSFLPKRRRKVRCTETGVVYESIKGRGGENKDIAERYRFSCIRDGRWLPLEYADD